MLKILYTYVRLWTVELILGVLHKYAEINHDLHVGELTKCYVISYDS